MKPDEDDNLTQEDLDAYKSGREGVSDGGFLSEPSSANIQGQMDKADADASREEAEEDSDDD